MEFLITCIVCVIFLIFIWRLWSWNSAYLRQINEYRELFLNIQDKYFNMLKTSRDMDSIGAYETNDELGIFFEFIKNTLHELDNFFTEE